MLPVPQGVAAWYITYLSINRYAPSTVHTYLSAINYVHRLCGGENLSEDFVNRKLLEGVDKSKVHSQKRLAITYSILEGIFDSLQYVIDNPYNVSLYKALFIFMYYSCARVGEVATSNNVTKNTLTYCSIRFDPSLSKVYVIFQNFKHNSANQKHTIPIRSTGTKLCPVGNLQAYLTLRGTAKGPLFATLLGRPVSAKQVWTTLKKALLWVGLDPVDFGTHSFRIGRCSDLAKNGASDAQIRFAGRFHSSAFLKYIRSQVFSQ